MIRSCNICQLIARKGLELVENSFKMLKATLWKRMNGRVEVSKMRYLSLLRDKTPERLQV
jgi:hypothetical protein